MLLALTLAACASADPAYYTLQSEPGAPLTTPPITIEIRRPGLAGYLDRSDIVLASDNYKLNIDSKIRWAEPLGDMIGRVIAEDLTQRLPNTTIYTQSGAISANPTIRLEIDILNFTTTNAEATLAAQIALEAGTTHHPITTRALTLSTPTTANPTALAAALSTLLAQLTNTIANQIQTTRPTP